MGAYCSDVPSFVRVLNEDVSSDQNIFLWFSFVFIVFFNITVCTMLSLSVVNTFCNLARVELNLAIHFRFYICTERLLCEGLVTFYFCGRNCGRWSTRRWTRALPTCRRTSIIRKKRGRQRRSAGRHRVSHRHLRLHHRRHLHLPKRRKTVMSTSHPVRNL